MRDDRTGIKADESAPPPKRDDGFRAEKPAPPWERPDCFRLDCEPHRGELLWWLAVVGLAMSALSACPLAVVGAGVALPLSLTTWVLARRDLARMRRGVMDPHGEEMTDMARKFSLAAFAVAAIASADWGYIYLVMSL
jgi:hypothetical protein